MDHGPLAGPESPSGAEEPPPRPLPPPPSGRELWEVFTQRLALRYPSWDASRVILVVAALVGVSGMLWVAWSPGRGQSHDVSPVRIVTSTTSTAPPQVPTTTLPEVIVVDVAGAIARPGPVLVHRGVRVADAIRAAGGVRDDADLERVDRAALVVDGQRVYVPRRGQTEIPQVVGPSGSAGVVGSNASGSAPATGSEGSAGSSLVDLNTATLADLDTLPGVGPATAQAIIDHRNATGRFQSVDELLEVKGIGPAKMATLRPHVTV